MPLDFVSLYLLSNVGITPSKGAVNFLVPAAEVYSKSIGSSPVPYIILSKNSLGNFFIGFDISTPYFLAILSKYILAIVSPFFMLLAPKAFTPSYSVLFLSGKIKSSSIFIKYPIPKQSGQAPNGLLNENILGVNSSILILQSGQA